MSVAEAVLLGVVQGLTEFLPISSSAHLVLVPAVLGMDDPPVSFLVLLHAATLIALVAYFRKELVELAMTFGQTRSRKVVWLLAAGTVPAAVIGYLFEEPFERSFGKPFQVALQLMATGVILAGIEVLTRRRLGPGADEGSASEDSVDELATSLSVGGAVVIGFAQALSIVPGISRSGATIAAGMGAGMTRDLSARFSFLLAIPILAGTSIFKAPDLAGAGVSLAAMVAGFIASLVSGYVAIWATIGYLRRRGLLPFAAYCLVVGGVLALFL